MDHMNFQVQLLLKSASCFSCFFTMTTWIGSDSAVLRHASGEFKRLGNRIFVFMIGGATRSEVCHLYYQISIPTSLVHICTYHFILQCISCARCTSLQR